jgi:glyoxylase-like metal-dependent hydrolase (beta-lactamase superfamily II)
VKDVRVEAEGLQHGRVHSADSPIRPGAWCAGRGARPGCRPRTLAVLTAGHTPGHQRFVVDLAGGGGLVFAFDAACTSDGCEREVPGGTIGATREEGAAQIRGLKRLAAGRGYQLIPGHDPVAWPALTASLGG